MSRSARAVALDVLIAVARDDAYANLLLPARIRAAGLDTNEAAFATECTYGTARFFGLYDWIISRVANRPAAKLDVLALSALRLGTHQLVQMRVHDHAAVNETVALVKERSNRGVAGFVNANLRAIAKRSFDEWIAELRQDLRSEVAATAMSNAHAPWIAKAFQAALDREGRGDELVELLRADNVAPSVHLVALPGLAERDDVCAAHPDRIRALSHHSGAMELRAGSPADIPEVQGGQVRVQDAGSQLAALTLAAAPVANSGVREQWLDLCAGPGGKSALLAATATERGASFIANEVVPQRAELVRQALVSIGTFEVWQRDGRQIGDEHPERFHRVLADVPCSGLGALRRRPEARWRKSRADLDELVPLQHALLDSAITACAIGGVIVYVTCSPAVEETTDIVARAIAQGRVRPLDTAHTLTQAGGAIDVTPIEVVSEHGFGTAVQLWPHAHETDAMFICVLERIT